MLAREEKLLNAVRHRQPVAGYTHGFYRYPAMFSPVFAREFISQFTKPGDLILDPFAGGGTSLVEARALGRSAIGIDISQLAVFVSNAKTTTLTDSDIGSIRKWMHGLDDALNLRTYPEKQMSGRNSDIKEISAVGQHGRHGRPWSSLSATSSI